MSEPVSALGRGFGGDGVFCAHGGTTPDLTLVHQTPQVRHHLIRDPLTLGLLSREASGEASSDA